MSGGTETNVRIACDFWLGSLVRHVPPMGEADGGRRQASPSRSIASPAAASPAVVASPWTRRG
jgi:hypothetical protein